MWFLGIDWGEHHHDLCLLDQDGRVLAARRIADGGPGSVSCTSSWPPMPRTQRRSRWGSRPTGPAGRRAAGRWLPGGCGQSAGCQPLSQPLRQLAGQVRPWGCQGAGRPGPHRPYNHRPVAGDSPLAEAIKVLARAPQSLIWARQRHVNALRSALGTHLAQPEALAVLALAPTPRAGPSVDPSGGAAGLGRRGSAPQPARGWWPFMPRWQPRSWPHPRQSRRPTARWSPACWPCCAA